MRFRLLIATLAAFTTALPLELDKETPTPAVTLESRQSTNPEWVACVQNCLMINHCGAPQIPQCLPMCINDWCAHIPRFL
ncbi:hypothetical protein B0T25DRAFT_547482 [Lasiosphaeria hispida]|uniref:Uncharacterized protein n=1 Tax=Lasiosphaeria hispida TaxID=260671 RepID=A0AAJ0HEL4_9PEZI|nr:hypothetical protein B0T25DRAFT_547482 [Lasiosphaeria hispida]